MKIIEQINPLKINKCVDSIIVKYSFFNEINKKAKHLFLSANPNINDNDISDIEVWLKLLREYKYIKSYSKIALINKEKAKYKEIWSSDESFIVSNKYLHSDVREIKYKVYFYDNRKKWNFLKKIRLTENIKINVDEAKINKILSGFSIKNQSIIKLIDFLVLEYSEYVNHNSLNINKLEDLLYFLAYTKKSDFKQLDLNKYLHIFFDKKNWDVYVDNTLIWNINIDTREYKLFEHLYINRWNFITHEEMKLNIDSKRKEKIASAYCSDIKRLLPDKIKQLIKSPKWWYLIP